jgi:hypothetical protein
MNPDKKAARREKNRLAKIAKAAERQANLAIIGKLVFEKEVIAADGTKSTTLNLPPFIKTSLDGSILPLRDNRLGTALPLSFIGAKSHPHQGLSRKNRPGNKELHTDAIVENASRSLAVEIDKALAPPVAEETPIPVIPENAVQEVAAL